MHRSPAQNQVMVVISSLEPPARQSFTAISQQLAAQVATAGPTSTSQNIQSAAVRGAETQAPSTSMQHFMNLFCCGGNNNYARQIEAAPIQSEEEFTRVIAGQYVLYLPKK